MSTSNPSCARHPRGTEAACGPCATARLRYEQHVAARPAPRRRVVLAAVAVGATLVATLGISTSASAVAVPPAGLTAPSASDGGCDPVTERPAVWDQVTGEVLWCEQRGEGPATGPDDCAVTPTDCQLPTLPVDEPAAEQPAADSGAEPAPRELAETGVTVNVAFLGGVGATLIALGSVLVLRRGIRRLRHERELRYWSDHLAKIRAGETPGPVRTTATARPDLA